MKKVASILIISILAIMLCACGENEYIRSVKQGHPKSYPDKTYGESFDDFFGNPKWRYFVGTEKGPDNDGDGKPDYIDEAANVVEFTGYCIYDDVRVKVLIQFILSKEDDTFSIAFMSFNDVPQSIFMISGLIDKVFDDEESTAEETVASIQDNESMDVEYNEGIRDIDYSFLEYTGEYEGKGGYRLSFTTGTDAVEGEIIGTVDIYYRNIFVSSQDVYLCYDAGNWSNEDYELLYVMHFDGYDEYIGFYQQDGQRMMDYNTSTRKHDTLIMTEEYVY